jgi:hypothetical protein
MAQSDVVIQIDEETHDELHNEYLRAVDAGYSEGFRTFVVNRSDTTWHVSVDGQLV